MPLQLTTTLAGEKRSWALDTPMMRVGRASTNAVCLPDATVSKEHAEITEQSGRWFVRDLGSRNGTRVNGQDAAQPHAIADGDLVEIGQLVLRVGEAVARITVQMSNSPGTSSSLRLRAVDIIGRNTVAPAGGNWVQLLAQAGQLLVLPRPLHETCDEILQLVEKAVPASRLVILLRDGEDAEPVQIAARYRGGSSRAPLAMSRTILNMVLNDCTSIVTGDAAHDPRFAGQQSIVAQLIHSAMAVPLFDNTRVLGAIYADTSDFSVTYGQPQLEMLTILANMAAVKITNARLLEKEQARLRMAQELATATRIQYGLLPAAPEGLTGWETHASLETCFEVGGDLYDFHVRPDGQLVFLLGDVSGKGMGAALLMSSVMTTARVLYDICDHPADLATRLNAVIHRSTEAKHFVTMFFGYLDLSTGRLRYTNAGHNPPFIASGGTLRGLAAAAPPVAVVPVFPFGTDEATLEPGDILAIFSDGFPEAQRGDEFYGEERLGRSLLEVTEQPKLEVASRMMLDRVEEFLQDAPRTDDMTLVLLRRSRV